MGSPLDLRKFNRLVRDFTKLGALVRTGLLVPDKKMPTGYPEINAGPLRGSLRVEAVLSNAPNLMPYWHVSFCRGTKLGDSGLQHYLAERVGTPETDAQLDIRRFSLRPSNAMQHLTNIQQPDGSQEYVVSFEAIDPRCAGQSAVRLEQQLGGLNTKALPMSGVLILSRALFLMESEKLCEPTRSMN